MVFMMKLETREIVYFLLNTNLNFGVRENIKAELEALEADRKRLELIKTHASKIYNDAGNHYVFRIALSNPNQTFIEALDERIKESNEEQSDG